MAARDITEGRSARSIAIELGINSETTLWQNKSESYDTAIGGLPFYYGIGLDRPYYRQTLAYKKDQFDSSTEPGEQSLTGWWLRSQSSFHCGTGIKYYDPSAGEVVANRFADSKGVDVWTKGQVSLLKKVNQVHTVLYPPATNKRTQQWARSIQWIDSANLKHDGVLLTDGYDVDKIYPTITMNIVQAQLTSNVVTLFSEATHGLQIGMQVSVSGVGAPYDGEFRVTAISGERGFSYAVTNADITLAYVTGTATSSVIHFIDYNSGADAPVYAICDDGTYAYWITNTSTKKTVYKKPLTGDSSNTADVVKILDEVGVVTNATMEYVKDRLVICANNKVYESSTSPATTTWPTAVYTHPASTHVYTSITASGPAIYIAGYNGIQSTIVKFTLSTTGVMPTLASALIAAELPVGEIVHKIFYYLGYMMIGTDKGIRVAAVSDADGSLSYGPLIVETNTPCYDFAARDKYVWCAASAGTDAGVIRIDLGTEIEQLVFAYANDSYTPDFNIYSGVTTTTVTNVEISKSYTYNTDRPYHHTTGCAFAGNTNQLLFTVAATELGGIIIEKEIKSNVGRIATSKPHGIQYGEEFSIEGVDSTFNSASGIKYISIPNPDVVFYVGWPPDYSKTLYFALVASNVAATAVSSSSALVKIYGTNYVEDTTELMPYGYLTTGKIRFNTLEPKHFERVLGRGEYDFGSMAIKTVDKDGTEYDVITYEPTFGSPEGVTSKPSTAQEYLAYKFELSPDTTSLDKGPVLKGYQVKALIATKRQRDIQFPVFCYDNETDKNGVTVGYEGRAMDRIRALETVEETGDVLIWQDFTTKETREVQIDSIQFTRMTPPEKRFSGFGGVIQVRMHTIS